MRFLHSGRSTSSHSCEDHWHRARTPNDSHFVAICSQQGRFPLHVTDSTEEKACYVAPYCAALF